MATDVCTWTPHGVATRLASRAARVIVLAVVASVLVMSLGGGGGGVEPASADGNCASHYPYKVTDGHSRSHDRDGDGVGCEANPRWPGSSSSSSTDRSASSGYDRDNWDYDSSAARQRLGCSISEHVDHVVALKEAYDSGASSWSAARKRQFANDPLNQWCLDAGLNQSKSDRDLAEWSGGSCAQRKHIASVTIAVKATYGLSIDSAERRANQAALAGNCAARGSNTGSNRTDQSTTPVQTTSSIAVRGVQPHDRSVTAEIPTSRSNEGWTASYLFSLVAEHGVLALWKWTGVVWLAYAEVDGFVVPGSTNFQVVAHDSFHATFE